MFGVAGKILRVDLTDRKITVDEPEEEFYRMYLGGAGIVSYYLLKEVPQGIDALSPENKFIYALGPMGGLAMPGATRACVGAKSPLTGGYSKSEVGGFVPMEIKKAGYDAIIVEGKADSPVYLLITDDGVDIKDASHLWGKTVMDAHDTIEEETGIRNIRTAAIGSGGENMVRYACVINDLKDAAGRGGLGAVMGSKNLKAIAARGRRGMPKSADPKKIRELTLTMNQGFMEVPLFNPSMSEVGTGEHSMMISGNEVGNMPSYNFGKNDFPATEAITATATMEVYGTGMEGCAACAIRCKKTVEINEPWNVDKRNGGPEYEALGSLGSTCGVDDLAAVIKANELANLYSLDSISLGVTIAFGMECFENEILTLEDTGGIDLRFGNAEALIQTIEAIAKREGIGATLAEGTKRAAEIIGQGAEEFAMQVKGLELPMHDPRVKQGLGIIYSMEAAGADHCAGLHDTAATQWGAGFEHMKGMGLTVPLPADDLSMDKVANQRAAHTNNLFKDSAIACSFVPWTFSQLIEIISAATGWSYTGHEAQQLGQRIATLGRIFNLREGIDATRDELPKRFFNGTETGGLVGGGIDKAKMDEAIHNMYAMMGWDEQTGVPTKVKLAELGISWAAEELPQPVA
ncbi:MAG: aldehyde ferredoxin oxidoreductase family protein [Dehalococcoidia bacterium]|nr:aldehyde ferredoxin oxidoreductase family protein [Dehalococcoidia bacterium]